MLCRVCHALLTDQGFLVYSWLILAIGGLLGAVVALVVRR